MKLSSIVILLVTTTSATLPFAEAIIFSNWGSSDKEITKPNKYADAVNQISSKFIYSDDDILVDGQAFSNENFNLGLDPKEKHVKKNNKNNGRILGGSNSFSFHQEDDSPLSTASISTRSPTGSFSSVSSTSSTGSLPPKYLGHRLVNFIRSRSRSDASERSEKENRKSLVADSIINGNPFEHVSPIEWSNLEVLTAKLGDIESGIIESYDGIISACLNDCKFENFDDFRSKVLKTLNHVSDAYKINAIIVSLASNLVYNCDNKAPNALKLFMDTKLSFMSKGMLPKQWIGSMSDQLKSILGEDEHFFVLEKNAEFQYHVSTLFLNATQSKTSTLHLISFYMMAFNSNSDQNDFIIKYAELVKILIDITSREKQNTEKRLLQKMNLDISDIKSTLNFQMELFIGEAIERLTT